MHRLTFSSCITAGLLFTASSVAAQSKHTEYRVGADVITSAINPTSAENAGIGDRAYGFQVSGSLVAYRVLNLNAEGGIIGMSDEAAFTQETTGGERTSDVAAGMGTVSAGLATPPLSFGEGSPVTFSAGVNAGQSWVGVPPARWTPR